jgi:plasmid stability protein
MATLTIRNLPEEVHDALRRQAAEHRRSMEAEAREVLRASVARRPTEQERAEALERLRTMEPSIKRALPEGWSQLDEDVADGHLEGAWENGFVSDEERRSWADRLKRFEVWPKDVEAFVASRIGAR